ncbi:MAG TPA: hypothetical protein VMO52_05100 [Acidimicrobiia bacterium]|nr:hypothetical protein [Acidimicrobiia bacterium]
MAPGRIRRVLLAVLAIGLAMDLVTLGITVHTRTAHPQVATYDYLGEAAIGGIFMLALTLLLVLRLPEHPVTWALLASSFFNSVQTLLGSYSAEALLAVPGQLPLGRLALAASGIAQTWFVLGFMLMVNLFPTGRPLSGWWKWVVRSLLLVAMVAGFVTLLSPMELGGREFPPLIENGIRPMGDAANIVLTVFFLTGTIAHVMTRFARARGIERQQLKWFVFTLVVGIVLLVLPWIENDIIGSALWAVVPVSVMASMAVAILRYRLYEIDRIVSRTVSYALVLVLLGLVVLGLVTVFALFLPSDDPLVVAVSTLAVAGLFNPLRRRVQGMVDRRFNRSRYDVERVIAGFAGALRERVDPGAVVDGWVGVVSETMQPVSVGVWVRER